MGRFLLLSAFILVSASQLAAQLYPPFQVKIFDTTATGYYFLCPIKVPNPGGAFRATQLILDKNGHVVYYRRFAPGVNTGDLKLQPNGWMSFSTQTRFFFMDSTFNFRQHPFFE
jgi:hypothetical protein